MRQIVELMSGLVIQAYETVKKPFQDLLHELKSGNRSARIKTVLVVGYIVVGLVTVVVFVPPGELNEIGAEVRIAKTEVVGGWYFLVSNSSDDDWTDIVLSMNDIYEMRWPNLSVGQKKAFFFHRFKDRQERAPKKGLVVNKLRVESRQGIFERDFTKKK